MATPSSLPITRKALGRVIRPFVGAKINRRRDPASKYGAYLPRLSAIDILTRAEEWLDADVRGVTDDGVVVYFYSGVELIPWDKVQGVRIVSMDAGGRRTSVTERRVMQAAEQVAA